MNARSMSVGDHVTYRGKTGEILRKQGRFAFVKFDDMERVLDASQMEPAPVNDAEARMGGPSDHAESEEHARSLRGH